MMKMDNLAQDSLPSYFTRGCLSQGWTNLSPFHVMFLFANFKIIRENIAQGHLEHITYIWWVHYNQQHLNLSAYT